MRGVPTLPPCGDNPVDIWERTVYPMARKRGMNLEASACLPASLFTQEFGWIDGKRLQAWKGGRGKAQQRHREHRAPHDHGIPRIRLIHNLLQ